MAINRNSNKKAEEAQAHAIKVLRARDFTKEGEDGCSITFDMEVNGVTIYGCWYREGKKKDGGDYTMVSFPSQKGKDGKYYNHAYVKLSEEEIQLIGQTIEKVLNA